MNALALASSGSSYSSTRLTSSPNRKTYHFVATSKPDFAAIDAALDLWLEETAFISSLNDMKELPSFEKLVSFGLDALPRIIASLSRSPSLLGLAAAEIVGDDPITDEIRGDVRAMTGAWIGWYQRAKRDFV